MRKINAENLITVTYETYAVAQRKPEKIQLLVAGIGSLTTAITVQSSLLSLRKREKR